MKSFETLRGQHEVATRAAATDPLTGVSNRRGFDDLIDDLTARTGPASDQVITVLIVDMDRFKEINDTHGHSAGDEALCQVTQALLGSVREGDTVARLGGDEFAALLPDIDPANGRRIARRMVDTVASLGLSGATVSVGVASGPAHAVRSTIAAADQAMYQAKRAGGNTVAAA
jgi:diguanylate cyclase (GGDEF)-like protein